MFRNFVSLFLLLSLAGGVAAQPSDSWFRGATVCPLLDRKIEPVYTLGLGYIFPGKLGGSRDFSMMEWDMNADFMYFRDVLLGDLDLRLDFLSVIPFNQDDLASPDVLMAVAMDVRWTWRYVNDTALQVQVEPGFYSAADSLDSRSLNMPITLAGYKTLDPSFAAVAGLTVRPGFERVVMPLAGVVWQPVESLRIEAMLPESRVVHHLGNRWLWRLGWAWESATYRMTDDDLEQKSVTLEAQRWTLGLTHAFNEELRLTGELGMLTGRTVEFDRPRRSKFDVDDAPSLRLAVSGAF